MQPKINIRPARLDDIQILEKWDQMPHVIACVTDDPENNPEEEWDWEAELAPRNDGTEFFLAEVNGIPIGMMQGIDPRTEVTQYWGPMDQGYRALDIWIGEVEFLGQGFGRQMMEWMIDRCFNHHKAHTILIDPLASNTRAHRFYESLGFTFQERRQFDDTSDCFVMSLRRDDWFSETVATASPKTPG